MAPSWASNNPELTQARDFLKPTRERAVANYLTPKMLRYAGANKKQQTRVFTERHLEKS